MKKIIIFALLFFVKLGLSQEINFYVKSSRTTISEDEKFNIEFISNVTPEKLIPPNFKDFSVLMGPSQSSSIYTQIINGKMTTEKKISYTYTLRPKRKGNLIIEQATIYASGKYYKTSVLEINVLDAKDIPQNSNSQTNVARQNVHFVVELSKDKVFIGEPIIATYKLYYNSQINSPNIASLPSFDGFINSEIVLNNDRKPQKGNYKGQQYNEYVLKQYILTPNKDGNIKLEPFKLDVNVEVPTGRVDWFGRNYVNEEQLTIKTDPRSVIVMELPISGKPENFSNAVGDFLLRMDVDRSNLNANESFQLKINLSGNGNIDLIKIPEPFVPSEIEKYDPKEKRDIKKTEKGISGNITKEYLMVPRYKGEYKIPSIEISYFSLKEKKYKTLKTNELTITIEKGNEQNTKSIVSENISSVQEKSKVEYLNSNKNISYIKLKTSLEKINNKSSFSVSNISFFLAYLLPFILTIIFIFIEKKKEKEAKDIVGTRKKKASKEIIKKLKLAKENLDLGKNKEFYQELENALLKFISDKFSIKTIDLSKENIHNIFISKKLESNIVTDFFKVIDNCQIAKYSPFFNLEEDKNIYENTIEIIEKINKIK